MPIYHTETTDLEIEKINENLSEGEMQVTLSPDKALSKGYKVRYEIVPAAQEEEKVEGSVWLSDRYSRQFICPKLIKKFRTKSLIVRVTEARYIIFV